MKNINRIRKKFSTVAMFLIIVLAFVIMPFCFLTDSNKTTARAETTSSGSMFDGVLKLIGEKGAGFIKSNLPTVGDFLCAQLFDAVGIDYSDSYTKELVKINEKLESIQKDLEGIIENQIKSVSQNTMREFYDTVDVFSKTVYPIYVGYNTIIRDEKDQKYSAEEAKNKESVFYTHNLKSIFFGSGTSTGDLYLQLDMLLEKIVTPNKTSQLDLMEHYHTTYSYLWAFEYQSFAPKNEFLGYVSTTALEGLMLYSFQNAYEMQLAIDEEDVVQQNILTSRWNKIKADSEKAFNYLKAEINAVENAEKYSNDTNTTMHYATGKKLSRKLYVGKMLTSTRYEAVADDSNYFTYRTYSYATSQKSSRVVQIYALNNRSFVDQIEKDFIAYKTNYKKGGDFTVIQFLQAVGFSCDNWDNVGIYGSLRYYHKGNLFTTEYWKFDVNYLNKSGVAATALTGEVIQAVLAAPSRKRYDSCCANYMAFVGTDGVLMGKFDEIYNEWGTHVVSDVYGLIDSKSYSQNSACLGKVW